MHLISFNREFFREFFCDLSVCYSVDSVILYMYLTIFQIHRFNHVCKCHCRKVILIKHKQGKQGEYLLYANLYMQFYLFYREQSFSPRKLTKSKIWLPFIFRKYLVKGVAFAEENDQNTGTVKFHVHSQFMSRDPSVKHILKKEKEVGNPLYLNSY